MSWDNTEPTALAAASAQTSTGATAVSAASGHSNTGPTGLAATSSGVAVTGDTEEDSVTVSNVSALTIADLTTGMGVRGAGILPGARIATLGATSFTLTIAAEATAADVALTAHEDPDAVAAASSHSNTGPTALAAASSQTSTGATGVSGGSAHDNTAPTALAAAASQTSTGATGVTGGSAHDNTAPTALAAASSQTSTSATALTAASAPTDSPALPVDSELSDLPLPTMASIFTPAFVELTGGGNSLNTLTASGADATAGRIVQGTVSGELKSYQVRAGTDAQALPGIVRPANFNADTNAVVFVQL